MQKLNYTFSEVLELMDKVALHFMAEKYPNDDNDKTNLCLASMAIVNVIMLGRHKPDEDSLEAKLLAIAKREPDGGYRNLLEQFGKENGKIQTTED